MKLNIIILLVFIFGLGCENSLQSDRTNKLTQEEALLNILNGDNFEYASLDTIEIKNFLSSYEIAAKKENSGGEFQTNNIENDSTYNFKDFKKPIQVFKSLDDFEQHVTLSEMKIELKEKVILDLQNQ